MLQGEKYPYEIVKHNFATLQGSQVVGVVKGESVAQSLAESFTAKLSQEERDAGWRHFIQRTTRTPTIHPRRVVGLKTGSFKSGRKRVGKIFVGKARPTRFKIRKKRPATKRSAYKR